MNTRRIPFQFSTTDPLARQKELEKRFGLQPTYPKMYVDVNNPLSMGPTPKETSSPRLQHRVPIFVEGYDQPVHSSSVDSMASASENKKPNVRVIPIEIEGADRSPRHRTYSGPAGTVKDRCDSLASERNGAPPFKRFNFEDLSRSTKPKLNAEPKIFNIPIQVEDASNVSRSSSGNKADATLKPKTKVLTSNGCSQSKTASKIKSPSKSVVPSESNKNQADHPKNTVEILLKKIEDILNEFKTYETGVVEFTGTSKDKQYRYLDEMLTRCMLRLDDIDTMGNEEVRLARKSAVKKIQAIIDLLESKANVEPVKSNEATEMQSIPGEKNVDNEVDMQDDNIASAESTTSFEANHIDSDQSKISDSKIESTKSEEKSNVTDVEMCEMPQTSLCETTNVDGSFESKPILLEGSSKDEDMMQGKENSTSSLQQQNIVPEIEMSEEILDKIDTMNDARSSELLESAGKCAEQNSVTNEAITDDVEMLDEKDMPSLVEVKESLDEFGENKSHSPKSSEIPEVEMEEIDDSSKESGEKKESDSKTVDHKSDYSEKKTDSGLHETVSDCLPDLSGENGTSDTSQSEKDKTLKD